jgi:hypothetical protein
LTLLTPGRANFRVGWVERFTPNLPRERVSETQQARRLWMNWQTIAHFWRLGFADVLQGDARIEALYPTYTDACEARRLWINWQAITHFWRFDLIKTVYKLILGWVILAAINFELYKIFPNIGTPSLFPISIVDLTFHPEGLVFAGLFLIVILLALKYSPRIKSAQIWGIAVLLLVLGNLVQGGIGPGFELPITDKGGGYYYAAIQITSARAWSATFNQQQADLVFHVQTHPLFAVLLHFEIMAFTGNQPLPLAIGLTFLTSLSVWLLWLILKWLDVPESRRTLLTLLFIVIPAFNIYGAVSLEGVILTTSLLFLYGLLRILKEGLKIPGILCFVAGILLTNALTFAGTFLLLVAFWVGIREYLAKRKWEVGLVLAGTAVVGVGVWLALKYGLGYDHLQSFITASKLENPDGFLGFAEPLAYFMTRIENIAEIAFFLSFGCLALFFLPETLKLKWKNLSDDPTLVFWAGMLSLFLVFLSGACKTGETARVCLFIYPYIFLLFRNVDEISLNNLILFAGSQTILMQLFGYFIW